MTTKQKILEVRGLHTYYGSIHALKGIDLDVYEGELVTLIGSNGAGKSTTLGSIAGIVPASEGHIIFMGKDITKMKPSDITKLGIGVSPEGREVFGGLSVEENLKIGAYTRKDPKEIAASFEEVYELFPRLAERRKQSAGTLSGGEQQMLAVGRAMVTGGELIMMDEPSMGLAPMIVEEIFHVIDEMHKAGKTILLVEQNAMMALKYADRAYLYEIGEVRLEGTAKDMLNDPVVKETYLGA